MNRRIRLLLLLIVVTVTLALAGTPSVSAGHHDGLICGTPNDPIPCSTFDNGNCIYSYDAASNCCVAHVGCLGVCC